MLTSISDTSSKIITKVNSPGLARNRILLDAAAGCSVGILSRESHTHERLTLSAHPGYFLLVFPLDDGDITDAWYDRCPAVMATTSRGTLHVFDLKHKWSIMSNSPFRGLAIEIPCDMLKASGAAGCAAVTPSVPDIRQSGAQNITSSLCRAAAALLVFNDEAHDGVLQHLIQAVIANLQLGFCGFRMYPRPSKERLAAWQEQRIRKYIAANLTDKIRVSDVSRSCGISCSHFSRLFKNTVGVTLHQWIVEQRIGEAKRLLIETNAAISEIASATGFADQAHFSRVFSRTTRATPMAWRRIRRA